MENSDKKEIKNEELREPSDITEFYEKGSIQEVLEEALGKERALAVMAEITNILGAPSPYRKDSVIAIMDYMRQIYVVADLKELITVRARLKNDRLVYGRIIFTAVPTDIVVYRPTRDNEVTRFKIVFEGKALHRPLVIGPTTLDVIIRHLRLNALVTYRKLAWDALSAIIDAYIRAGRAEIRDE